MKIVRTDAELTCPLIDQTLREAGHDLVLLPDNTPEDDVCKAVGDADMILMCYQPITARIIEAAPRLRGIVKYGVGIDAIDIPAAKARGVTVVNIPEYAENTVAEGAFLLMLSLLRKLPPLHSQMQNTGWAWPEPEWLGRDLAGLTVGLVGLGRIGRAFARMVGQGFLARTIAYSPNTPAETFAETGVERADTLHAMLAQSDVVSIHAVLNDDTRHLINADAFAAMKPGALLINVSRGAIVDEQALIKALDSGHLGGAGVDVFSKEPLALESHSLSPLFGRDNVILTPHLTFYTEQAMERLERETLERVRELVEGRPVSIKSPDPRLAGQENAIYPT